jgi:proteasome accessory factor B/proteasome accessory factor C
MADIDSPRDKSVRLFTLIVLLTTSHMPRSRAEIFDKMSEFYRGSADARERMFERDKKALRELGIVIDSFDNDETNELVGYRINLAASQEHRVNFTPDEAVAVSIASRLLAHSVDAESIAHTALSIDALAGGAASHWLAQALTPTPAPPALDSLASAIRQRQRVTFNYRKPGEDSRQRTVEPWVVVAQAGHWYVCGFEPVSSTKKAFRLDRIHGAVTASPETDAYSVPEDLDVVSLVSGPGAEAEAAVLKVRVGCATSVRRLAHTVSSIDDDWDECTLVNINEERLVRLVLQHAPNILVRSPETVADRVHGAITSSLVVYARG